MCYRYRLPGGGLRDSRKVPFADVCMQHTAGGKKRGLNRSFPQAHHKIPPLVLQTPNFLSFYDNEKVGGRDAVLLKDERKFYLMCAARW